MVDVFVYWDDAFLSGFDVRNGGFETPDSKWKYSDSGPPWETWVMTGESRSGFVGLSVCAYYMGTNDHRLLGQGRTEGCEKTTEPKRAITREGAAARTSRPRRATRCTMRSNEARSCRVSTLDGGAHEAPS